MKKTPLTIFFVLMSLAVFSQKIKVTSGSIDFLKNEKTITAEFTYEGMQVGSMRETDYVKDKIEDYNKKEKGRGYQWYQAWVNDRESRFQPKFIELFNERIGAKNGPTIGEDGGYIMLVNTHFSEPGFNVGVTRRNASVSMTCTFINKETEEEAASVSITNSSANSFWGTDFDTGYRLQESYAKAGRELAKFFIKQLKLK
ncbi:MAG: hypothetical protein LBG19_03060 [Prevotellaceae bacterium]|jgi:hypothetical protein|nr:hypothetical protein [Prevotellaceae bacterium]